MRDIRDIKAAVVGTGFIGVVHVEALRRLGIEVTGIVGSTPGARGREGAHGRAPGSLSELRGDARRPRGRGRPPHDARTACTSSRSRRRSRPASTSCARSRSAWTRPRPPSCCGSPSRAGSSTRSTSTSASTPQCQEARARVAGGRDRRRAADQRRLPAGLAAARHRLELAAGPRGGRLAARGRRHRLALARPRPVRHRPPRRGRDGRPHDVHPACASSRPARSRRSAARAPARRSTRRWRPRTPPASCCASAAARARSSPSRQVSAGRKNRLSWEIDGSDARARVALRGAGGAVDRPPRPAERAAAARGRRLPARPRRGLPRHVQAPLPRGLRARWRPAGRPTSPTTRRSPTATTRRVIADAIARSHAEQRWVTVDPGAPGGVNEARPAHGGLPDADARRDRRLGGGQRLRDARGRVLAGRRGRRAPLRGRLPHRRRHARRREGGRDRRRPRAPRPEHLGARLLPQPAVARRRGARGRPRAPAQGDRRRAAKLGVDIVGTFVGRDRVEEPAGQPRRLPRRRGRRWSRTPPSTACGSRSRTAR